MGKSPVVQVLPFAILTQVKWIHKNLYTIKGKSGFWVLVGIKDRYKDYTTKAQIVSENCKFKEREFLPAEEANKFFTKMFGK